MRARFRDQPGLADQPPCPRRLKPAGPHYRDAGSSELCGPAPERSPAKRPRPGGASLSWRRHRPSRHRGPWPIQISARRRRPGCRVATKHSQQFAIARLRPPGIGQRSFDRARAELVGWSWDITRDSISSIIQLGTGHENQSTFRHGSKRGQAPFVRSTRRAASGKWA